MAPVPQNEAEVDSHTSDLASQDSPLRRQFSEPIHARSTSTQASPSPSPVAHPFECPRCTKYFEPADGFDPSEALKNHIASSEVEGEDHAEVTENGVTGGTYHDKDPSLDGDDLEADGPEADALSNQLHEFSRDQDPITLDQRLQNLWNVHDIRNFSSDYDEKATSLDQSWTAVLQDPKRTKKRETVEFAERPEPYRKPKAAKGEFLEITALEDFLAQLRDPEQRSTEELYAITENVAYALKAWQDEYLAIEKLHKLATRHNAKPISDPRKLLRPQVFEDKKEAMLYGYKYEAKEDKVGSQNPFTQGGFKPTPAQFRKMTAKIGANHPNPDGWRTIMRFGVEHVPKFQNPPREEFVGKATRKRKAAELEAANREMAASGSDEAAVETPTQTDVEEYGVRRRTRGRRPGTDDDGLVSIPTRGALRGRGSGRGRGRGAARVGAFISTEPSQQLTAMTSVARPSSGRVENAPGLQARPPTTHLALIEPAPAVTVAPADSPVGAQGDGMDPAEQARRQKIANSKNPKRTEAMLNHWARFNREGRVRNPKRSKAQIEADRAAEAARKATEPPKPGKLKKKPEGGVYGEPARPNAGIAPAPMPASTLLAPGPTHHQLAPIAAPRPSLPPYSPIDPRTVAPFPGPHGLLQQAPLQPYRTPYPDYYSPYGAPAPGLPPSHPRPT
ncbi:hypothetical protein BO94DRAFT_506466 [Aspergillus sclerotioniger CBS 115572]|uniref:Uncharacterized protein n=1 Tax=Aspergillus sclerotioniger CBS 115572 TaxID=1450535 RepID=A0A317XCQ4_9EURO|nr:hypothetical protein BO94DRAFT_506466 [Aspergillus sclerotioniger CBS 115572]PWY95492.1 hypothetical protein BO94DRAFT_506466 [Aspergillus sclerotioniger CBS 115572]